MTTTPKNCDTVATIYEKKRQEGLLDVKFLLKNRSGTTHTQACEGFKVFQKAIADGKGRPLNFGDYNWK